MYVVECSLSGFNFVSHDQQFVQLLSFCITAHAATELVHELARVILYII